MTASETWRNVGSKIRYLRKASGLTLKQLARGCNLSANTISMVERSEVSPSIETICKIANALGVAPSSLFLEICHPRVVLQRAGEDNQELQISEQALRGFAGVTSAAVCGAGAPHSPPAASSPSRYFVLCLSGQVELELDTQTYLLNPGDNLAFDSDAFHRWRNTGSAAGVAVLVLSD